MPYAADNSLRSRQQYPHHCLVLLSQLTFLRLLLLLAELSLLLLLSLLLNFLLLVPSGPGSAPNSSKQPASPGGMGCSLADSGGITRSRRAPFGEVPPVPLAPATSADSFVREGPRART